MKKIKINTTDPTHKLFLLNIHERMREENLDSDALAGRCGIKPSTFYKLMSGTNEPGMRQIRSIATALGCTVAELFDGEKQPNSKQVVNALITLISGPQFVASLRALAEQELEHARANNKD